MENAKVSGKDGDVDVLLNNIKKDKVDAKIKECSTGNNSCCSPDFTSDNRISTSEDGNSVKINITGKASKKEVQENINHCNCFDDE
ncbi:hypothetical protein [Ferroplasma sp.]|uniref:hypothetical protein n=1 Tax=Ferroplasma sp. TaxID=2591003 RepID=UPI00307DE1FF